MKLLHKSQRFAAFFFFFFQSSNDNIKRLIPKCLHWNKGSQRPKKKKSKKFKYERMRSDREGGSDDKEDILVNTSKYSHILA